MISFIKEMASMVGCFILPKYMMKSFEAVVPKSEDSQTDLPEPITSYFSEVMTELYGGQREESYGVTNDFFQTMKKLSVEDRKSKALDIYKLIFRFSIEKLTNFLVQESFLMILYQYTKETQMKRIHQRSVLEKNMAAYYRALENMFNFSEKN